MRSVRPACSWAFSLPTDPHSHKKPSDSPGGSFFIVDLSLSAGSSRNYRCSDFSISCSGSLFHHFPRVFPFFDPFRQKRSLSGMDSDLSIFISVSDHFPGHLCGAPQCVVGRCNHITQLGQFPVSASFRAVSANLAMAALSVSLLYTKDTISPGGWLRPAAGRLPSEPRLHRFVRQLHEPRCSAHLCPDSSRRSIHYRFLPPARQ